MEFLYGAFYNALPFIHKVLIPQMLYWIVLSSIIWLPILITPVAWSYWTRYTRYKWQTTRKYVVMEIKLPAETIKSPAAMELALHALIQTGGEGSPVERYWEGKSRPWASLELCVINGEIRFFIWAFEGQKNTITSALYSQYPDISIIDVEDYTKEVYQNRHKYGIWACQYEFIKADAYPIKTYVDYGLSDDPDEEFKVDPLVPLIEAMGTVKPDNQVWFQFITRAHTGEKNAFNKTQKDEWIAGAKEEIEKIIESASVERVEVTESGSIVKTMVPATAKMTTEKKDAIDAISRSIAKQAFDVGIRCFHIHPAGKTGDIRRDLIKGAFRQFGSNSLNSIKPNDQDFTYYWEDPVLYFNLPFGEPRNAKLAEHLFHCYITRSYFFYPYVHGGIHWPLPWQVKSNNLPNLVLNTEELATLYHFPGSTSKAPGLKRIPSKRAAPPSNLPI